MANQYRSILAGGAATGGDALPANVLSGKTFTNDNGPQTGTMVNNGAVSQTIAAGQSYTVPEGYHNGNGTVTAGKPTEYKCCVYNQAASNADATLGFNFTPEQLDGFSTITVTSNKSITRLNYIVDGTSFSNVQTGSSPFTIPAFSTNLMLGAKIALAPETYVEVIATLS